MDAYKEEEEPITPANSQARFTPTSSLRHSLTPAKIARESLYGYLEDLYQQHLVYLRGVIEDPRQSLYSDSGTGSEEESSQEEYRCGTKVGIPSDDDDNEEEPDLWNCFMFAAEGWPESLRPTAIPIDYESLELTEEEEAGVLTQRVAGTGLSYLTRCPETNGFIMAKLVLRSKYLCNISLLANHRYLQYIDLCDNKLTDISPLGNIPYLMYLDVSDNDLTNVLDIPAPWYLTYVNFSYNNVVIIDDLSRFWSLTYLNLAHNMIKQISGVNKLRFLRHLDLSHNDIVCIEGLNNMPLSRLVMHHNKISTYRPGCLGSMPNLGWLDLCYNELASLSLFKGVSCPRTILIANNAIEEPLELEKLQSLLVLTELDLRGNQVVRWDNYREVILHAVPSLQVLDGMAVKAMEKVSAKNLFQPTIPLLAAWHHAQLQLLMGLHKPQIDHAHLPADQGFFPMVVLVGPASSHKALLVKMLATKLCRQVRIGVNHTTRPAAPDEEDGVDYHFISQDSFHEMTRNGEFLCVSESLGHSYGLSRRELELCVLEHRLCLTHTDLLCATTLARSLLRPYLVLTLLDTVKDHYRLLRSRFGGTLFQHRSLGAVNVSRRSTVFPTVPPYGSGQMIAAEVLTDLLEYTREMSPSQRSPTPRTDRMSDMSDSTLQFITSLITNIFMIPEYSPSCCSYEEMLSDDTVTQNTPPAHFESNEKVVQMTDLTENATSAKEGTVASTQDMHSNSEKPTEQTCSSKVLFAFYSKKELDSSSSTSSKSTSQVSSTTNRINHNTTMDSVPNKEVSYLSTQSHTHESCQPSKPTPFVPNQNKSCLVQKEPRKASNSTQSWATETYQSPSPANANELHQSTADRSSQLFSQESVNALYQSPSQASEDELYQSLTQGSAHTFSQSSSQATADEPCQSSSKEKPVPHWTREDEIAEIIAAEEQYIASILEGRDIYIKIHQIKPGFFSEIVFTTNLTKAQKKLHKFVQSVYSGYSRTCPQFCPDDGVYRHMVEARLSKLRQELQLSKSVMRSQIFKALHSYPVD